MSMNILKHCRTLRTTNRQVIAVADSTQLSSPCINRECRRCSKTPEAVEDSPTPAYSLRIRHSHPTDKGYLHLLKAGL